MYSIPLLQLFVKSFWGDAADKNEIASKKHPVPGVAQLEAEIGVFERS